MTLYMLFAGLGVLIYTGVAYAASSRAGFGGAHLVFALEFALFLSLLVVLVAVTALYTTRFLRQHSFRVDHVAAWRTRLFIAAVAFLAGGVGILIGATRPSGDAMSCAQCGASDEAITTEASIISLNGSLAAVARVESERALATGRTLFQERGCIGCHRPDGTGVGPALEGRFGGPVHDPGCGATVVDEAYVREAILNPSATVAAGYPPVMPTFAGRLTEEDLQALIVYVKSLQVE